MFYVVHRQILYKFVAQDLAAETGKGGVQLPDIINRDKAIVNLAIQWVINLLRNYFILYIFVLT